MTYNEFIQNILDTRGRFGISEEEYKERHHIVPKCIGGSNYECNLIDLYAREHYIAHKLLMEENPNNKSLLYAFSAMAFKKNGKYNSERQYMLTEQEYEDARISFSNGQKGKIFSDETKKKMSLARMGKEPWNKGLTKYTDERLIKLSESVSKVQKEHPRAPWNKGLTKESDCRVMKYAESGKGKHTSYGFLGKHHTDESNEKNRQAHIGKKYVDRRKSVICVETGEIFEKVNDTPSPSHISACCRGKRNVCLGYHWQYLTDYNKSVELNL